MESQNSSLIQQFITAEDLPPDYADDAQRWFLPLVDELKQKRAATRSDRQKEVQLSGEARQAPLFIGINGAQGTGKSTLGALLDCLLSAEGYRVANLSIDDFYLSKAARLEQARDIHPLFRSRGMPGSHNMPLFLRKIAELQSASSETLLSLPRFDKAHDDCVPEDQWPTITGPVDFIILEGWIVGLQPETEEALTDPINPFEKQEDSEGIWRRTVNNALAGDYQRIFAELDMLVLLKAPSFDQVFEWRQLQEDKLRQRQSDGSELMDQRTLSRFIQHFERLTCHSLKILPAIADRVFVLDEHHRVVSCAPALAQEP